MKISNKLLAGLLAGLSANSAFAIDDIKVGPASLSIYGRASAGIDYVHNSFDAGLQGDRWSTAANQWGVSYWGMQARFAVNTETSAFVNLESAFGTDTGALEDDDTLFNRRANVGMQHAGLGSLSIGTHLWIAQDIEDLDPMHFQSIGINSLVNGANDGSAKRSVLLRSPDLGGFTLAYMHSFGGKTGAFKRESSDGVSLGYRNQDLNVRAIYGRRADEFGRYSGGEAYGLGSREPWKFIESFVAGASYRAGKTTFFAGGQAVKAPDAGYGIRVRFDDKARMFWLGVNHDLTAGTKLLAAAYQLKQSYSGKKATLGALGINHDLNQYVKLYATVGYVGNNTISADMVANAGESNHALSYYDSACDSSLSCNGANQVGGYAGFVVKF